MVPYRDWAAISNYGSFFIPALFEWVACYVSSSWFGEDGFCSISALLAGCSWTSAVTLLELPSGLRFYRIISLADLDQFEVGDSSSPILNRCPRIWVRAGANPLDTGILGSSWLGAARHPKITTDLVPVSDLKLGKTIHSRACLPLWNKVKISHTAQGFIYTGACKSPFASELCCPPEVAAESAEPLDSHFLSRSAAKSRSTAPQTEPVYSASWIPGTQT
ncbi:hypothetical protein K449DRAFT_430836 [Hypoxylon sp. EC38]|nr:hypothetical protein K449DRAFT_430836 [Hypoxylon sp. EC38]